MPSNPSTCLSATSPIVPRVVGIEYGIFQQDQSGPPNQYTVPPTYALFASNNIMPSQTQGNAGDWYLMATSNSFVLFNKLTQWNAITTVTGSTSADLTAVYSAITTINASLGSISASVSTETNARVTADEALSNQITSLTAAYNTSTASITQILLTTATETYVQAQSSTTLNAANATSRSLVNSEIVARQTADGGLASSITTVSTTANSKNRTFVQTTAPISSPSYTLAVNDLWVDTASLPSSAPVFTWNGSSWVTGTAAGSSIGAALSVEATSRSTADGFLSSNYSVTLDVNGTVTGMQFNSSTGGGATTSTVTFEASVFQIYNGVGGQSVFTVSGGNVYMANAIVSGELDIGTSLNRVQINSSGMSVAAGEIFFGNSSGNASMHVTSTGYSGVKISSLNSVGSFIFLLASDGVTENGVISGSGSATLNSLTIAPAVGGTALAVLNTQLSGNSGRLTLNDTNGNQLVANPGTFSITSYTTSIGTVAMMTTAAFASLEIGPCTASNYPGLSFGPGTSVLDAQIYRSNSTELTCTATIVQQSNFHFSTNSSIIWDVSSGASTITENNGVTVTGDTSHPTRFTGSIAMGLFNLGGSSFNTGYFWFNAGCYFNSDGSHIYATSPSGSVTIV